ncbi:GumC family protein [Croceivirga sp. JEA036]|uniref:GumC family protein n=1 Tax=Croceivirga sp. JEA036 TaxID=2721162 RepID=UPI00143B237B|nr:tyrosine-protein kinase [Croceivirga sp. JEA036]NJB35375.1 polysaccharide biosynthesis tyrosine autokinase [Croceivirga sp. JEA036]
MTSIGKNALKEELRPYLKNWYWFVLSLLLFITLGFFVIRYTTPKYKAQAKVQIVDEQGSGGLDLFKELDIFSGSKNKVEDEIEIIASRSNLIAVVEKLKLNTVIQSLGNIRNTELYKDPPINLNLVAPDSIVSKSQLEFFFHFKNKTKFEYALEEGQAFKTHAFGEKLATAIGDIVVTPNISDFDAVKKNEYKVSFKPVNLVAENYKKKIKLGVPREYSNIITLSLEDPVREKAQDILNELILTYNNNAIKDKQEIADKTSEFINARITDISTNLSDVDQSAEDFKTGRGVTDISSEANINLNVGASNRQELASAQTQLNIASSMKSLVDQQNNFEVLPANLGLSDATIANTTQQYNQLVQERQRLLKSSNEKNPVIVNLDQQLQGLKRTMQASLNSTVNNLGMQVNTLSGQQAIINSKIYSAPKNERALRDITRRQQTTESLYLYLLQKREESQIAVASTAPKSKVVESAYYSNIPVAPKKKIIFLAFGIMGLLLPFGFIYTKNLLSNKVENMNKLEGLVNNIPIIGELPRITKSGEKLVSKSDRSVLAESLRIIRANLDYILKSKKGNNNLIFISSGISGEGKTFLSLNLALTMANTNKRVLLIGADIRNPKFEEVLELRSTASLKSGGGNKAYGLTDFLSDEQLDIRDVISSLLIKDSKLDVVFSGKVPPNPTELLMNSRMERLLEETAYAYDYVIVDTAPLMLVSDTLHLARLTENFIYVVRSGITEKDTIQFPIKLKEEGKINGLMFVVNDVKEANLGYAGKYGYGYGANTKPWYKFW